jgi:hypothetical protein
MLPEILFVLVHQNDWCLVGVSVSNRTRGGAHFGQDIYKHDYHTHRISKVLKVRNSQDKVREMVSNDSWVFS